MGRLQLRRNPPPPQLVIKNLNFSMTRVLLTLEHAFIFRINEARHDNLSLIDISIGGATTTQIHESSSPLIQDMSLHIFEHIFSKITANLQCYWRSPGI